MIYLSDEHSIELSVQFSAFSLLIAYASALQIRQSVTMHFPAQNHQKDVSNGVNKCIV